MEERKNTTLDEWNAEITLTLIPNIVLLSFFAILGVFGNLLVVVVYKFQMKKVTEQRYFIPILGFFDMVAAGYCISVGIYQNLHHGDFSNKEFCQTMQFFIGFTTFTPIIILLIIAFQRFFKVCKPRSVPISLKFKRWLVILSIGIALVVALPIPFVYGIMPLYSNDYMITGTRCGKLKEGMKAVRALYGAVIGLFALIVTAMLLVLYSRIGKQIYRNIKGSKSKRDSQFIGNGKSQNLEITTDETSDQLDQKTEESSTSTNEKDQKEFLRNINSKREIECDFQQNMKDNTTAMTTANTTAMTTANTTIMTTANTTAMTTANTTAMTTAPRHEHTSSHRRRKRNRHVSYKITLMFIVITIAFFVSYLPKVAMLLVEGLHKEFWENLDNHQRPGVIFIYQMFVINNIVNPIIYAFMDTKFRKETRKLFQRFYICHKTINS